jgi:hypothetical protein
MSTFERTLLLIAKVNKILCHTAAKDRLIRLIQYLMKFLTFSLPVTTAAKARKMELMLIDARKVFRFLRFLESFVNMQKLLKSMQAMICTTEPSHVTKKHQNLPLKSLQLIQQSGLCAFFLSDHALLLSKLSITSHDPVFLRQVFGGVWLVACLSGMGADVIRLQALLHEGKKDISEDILHLDNHPALATMTSARALGLEEKQRVAKLENSVDLVLNGLNAFIALNLSNKHMPYHRGVVGACGMVTSSIQLWQIYRNHAMGEALAQRLEVPFAGEEEEEEGGRGGI